MLAQTYLEALPIKFTTEVFFIYSSTVAKKRFSVYIFCRSVVTLSNLKLHNALAVKNTFIQEPGIQNPGWALIGFRTTGPRRFLLLALKAAQIQLKWEEKKETLWEQ